MVKTKVAFMYDFDNTLAPGNMQEAAFVPECGLTPDEFWSRTSNFAKEKNIDSILAYMYTMISLAKEKNVNISRKAFAKQGERIKFFDGVEEWFSKINKEADKLGLEIEHYIISCGQKEIIEGCKIAKEFKRIFASCFCFDENDQPYWPANAVNYTTKTQYIYRIRKNKLDNLYDFREINEYIPQREKLLPYRNMVYFGDGETDIPCMKKIKVSGGHSVCLYSKDSKKQKEVAEKIYNDGRVDFIAPNDYREGEKLYQIAVNILKTIALRRDLDDLKTNNNI